MSYLRKFTSLFLLLTLVLSIATPAFASQNLVSDNTRNEEKVIKSFRMTENGLKELTVDELAQLELSSKMQNAQKELLKSDPSLSKEFLNSGNTNSNGNITPMAPPFCGTSCTWAVYKQISKVPTQVPSMRKRITPAVQGGPVIFTSSGTFEKSINISLTGIVKDALEAVLGAQWSKSTTVGIELQVQGPPKQFTWYEFTPVMYNSFGWTATYENNYYTSYKDKQIKNEWTDIYMGKTTGKYQDGIYHLVSSPYPPRN